MEKYSFDFIKIDLRLINNLSNAKRILEDNGIDTVRIDVKLVYDLKLNCDIIFLDVNTYNVFAYCYKKSSKIELAEDFESVLKKAEPIKYFKREKTSDELELKLDYILEKISLKGIKSLSPKEKEFLDSQSQK
jgi:hypothetical protein